MINISLSLDLQVLQTHETAIINIITDVVFCYKCNDASDHWFRV